MPMTDRAGIDRTEPDSPPGDQQEPQRRKPWHAPQFISTDLAETDTQGNGGGDGGPMGSPS
jgi:hypothetical protein